ncbi:MAG: CAP domain-containing protein [Pseudomonadota bacterium]
MRNLYYSILALFCLIGTADAACEYRPEWRGSDIATYVPDADACLTELKDGFWIDEAVENEVFDQVNAARAEAGLTPLARRRSLLRPARLHSFDMGQDAFFAHNGPDGRSVSDRVAALDRTLVHSEIRENIAKIEGDLNWSETGEILHNILFNSDSHRENMLAPRLTHMAIGLVRTEKGAWITQIFVRVEGEFVDDVPLVMSAKSPALPTVQLSDWRFSETRLQNGDSEYQLALLDPMASGDTHLRVVGTRAASEFSYQTIKLAGPTLTLVEE